MDILIWLEANALSSERFTRCRTFEDVHASVKECLGLDWFRLWQCLFPDFSDRPKRQWIAFYEFSSWLSHGVPAKSQVEFEQLQHIGNEPPKSQLHRLALALANLSWAVKDIATADGFIWSPILGFPTVLKMGACTLLNREKSTYRTYADDDYLLRLSSRLCECYFSKDRGGCTLVDCPSCAKCRNVFCKQHGLLKRSVRGTLA
jgi:hypothetical protein